MRGIDFFVDRPVTYHSPARGTADCNVQPMFGIKTHRLCHNDGGRTGDRNKRYGEVFLLDPLDVLLGESLCCIQWKHRTDERRRTARPDKLEEAPARQLIATKNGPFHSHFYGTIQTFLRCTGDIFVLIPLL